MSLQKNLGRYLWSRS